MKNLFAAIMLMVCATPCFGYGNHQALQIIMPRASGTGTPAIPSTHRSFYAYTGIEYKIRAQVVGGLYPYAFTLSNAPTGMAVDADGYITWENPDTTASNITLRATDQDGDYVESTWSITVQTSGFKFVDASAEGGGSGTLVDPYDTISAMLSGASSTDIIYFRTGTYVLPSRGDHTIGGASAFEWNDPSDAPARWLAYPGEQAVINMGGNRYFYGDPSSGPVFYFDGITFLNGREYVFRTGSGQNYPTFLDCTFDGLTIERTSYNSNQGGYFTGHTGTGYFLTFQGCTFTGFRDTQGIGSIYNQNTFLIEDNIFEDFGRDADSTLNQFLALKVGIVGLTFRKNSITASGTDWGFFGGSTNAMMCDGTIDGHGPQSSSLEFCYNLFKTDSPFVAIRFNNYDDMGATWFYRNTVVNTSVQMEELDYPSECDGPWYFEGNVFQNADSGVNTSHYSNGSSPASCLSLSDNLGATSGLVDSSGLLVNRDYVGTYGWETVEPESPSTAPRFQGMTFRGMGQGGE